MQNVTTPLRNIRSAIAPLLTKEERLKVSEFFLGDAVKLSNGNRTVEYKYKNPSKLFGLPSLNNDDMFIGVYHSLQHKEGKRGEWTNATDGLSATNAALSGLYNAPLRTTIGGIIHINDLYTQKMEGSNDHQGDIEAGTDQRILGQPFVYKGNASNQGTITVPEDYGSTFSEETGDPATVADADQMYSMHGYYGLRIRDFGATLIATDWTDFETFLMALEERKRTNPSIF